MYLLVLELTHWQKGPEGFQRPFSAVSFCLQNIALRIPVWRAVGLRSLQCTQSCFDVNDPGEIKFCSQGTDCMTNRRKAMAQTAQVSFPPM